MHNPPVGWGLHQARERLGRSLHELGPGIVTGAADDDPSGIATYSQAGAQFGYGLLWTLVLTYPLMSAVQLVSAHIGRVTGCGLARNLRECFPTWLVTILVSILLAANMFNIGADLAAMAALAAFKRAALAPMHRALHALARAPPIFSTARLTATLFCCHEPSR